MPNQNQPNRGSFGAAIGGSGALKQAMERRGIDVGLLEQVSPVAPTAPSEVAPALPADTGGVAPPGGVPAIPAGVEKAPFRSGEAEIAIKSLAQVARTESKIAEAALIGIR